MQRRTFLQQALAAGTAAGVPALLPAAARAATPRPPPGNRVALGFVGLGSHGVGMNLQTFLQQPDAQVAALCDVDAQRLRDAEQLTSRHYAAQTGAGAWRGCATTGDWRALIARPDVDAVVISTPDHWHVPIAIAAARAGKDVFCEKPLTLTIGEGRLLCDAVRRYGRIFQTASENRSKPNFLRACELVRNGRIGRLHTLETWLPRGWGVSGAIPGSFTPEPVPAYFDYDMWLGPTPEVPYSPARCHYNFRWIRDYSGGHITDWGAHLNDIAQWANGSDRSGPVRVEGAGSTTPHWLFNTVTDWEILYTYASGVRLICRSGTPALRFTGTDGWVYVPTWEAPVEASSPAIANAVIGPEELHLRTCPEREQRDFLNSVRSRQETYAPAEVGHRTMTLCHLGNIAIQLGRPLAWDPAAERFSNDDQANRLLARTARAPWSVDML